MKEFSPSPEFLLTRIEEQTVIADQTAKKQKAVADEASHIYKVLEKITLYLKRGWFLHVLALTDKEAPLLEKMRANNHPAIPSLEEIFQTARERVEELKPHRFPSYLEEACCTANLALDKDSRHPNYKFKNGFFHLHIDEHKKTARLSNTTTTLCEIPADIAAIVDVLKSENQRLFERSFDAKKFLKKIRVQYLALLKIEKLSDGTSIPIRNITRRLGKNEKGFRTDEFLVDLSRLIEQEILEIDGQRFELQQTKFADQGLLLHSKVTQSYVGFVLFKKI